MGMIEIELGLVFKEVLSRKPELTEPLMRKMALVIERQASALKTMQWHKESVEKAEQMDKILFEEIKKMRQDLSPHENTQETKAP